MQNEKLTENFSLSEFLASDFAIRRGIPNIPTDEVLTNIRTLLAPGMQRIRDLLNHSVNVSSGFRSHPLNSAIGGSVTSQHMDGLAADFTAPAFGTPKEISQFLLDNFETIKFDQLIQEGTWVHVSFASQPRKSVLTAHFLNGKTTYTNGIT